jgi:murein DD-endopeptidase MepM/ murein hydrolase activator NlpD
VEKAIPVKDEPASKAVAKTEAAKTEPPKEKTEKPAVVKDKAPSEATAKTAAVKIETPTAKTEKATPAKDERANKGVAKTDSVKVETVTAQTEKAPVKEKPATVAAAKTQKDEKTTPAKEEPASKTVAKTETPKSEPVTAKAEKSEAAKEKQPTKNDSAVAKTEKATPVKEETASKKVAKSDSVKAESAAEKEEKAPAVKEQPAKAVAKTQPAKVEAATTKAETPRPPAEGPITVAKTTTIKAEPISVPALKDPPQIIPALSGNLETGLTKLADGFDFPVGKPDAENYYKARGFRPGGHVGEDWDGIGGGDTDLKDPIYSIGDGIVVFARDVRRGWGNVIIVRHAYREGGTVKYIDALYGHLNTMMARRGQKVARGQQIGTMGTAHGQYDAHLHFEIRKNLEIGMSRSKFQKSFSNYYDPTQFINSRRQLSGGGSNYKVAMNTFTHDWAFRFDGARNFPPRKRSTAESSAALRRALTSTR